MDGERKKHKTYAITIHGSHVRSGLAWRIFLESDPLAVGEVKLPRLRSAYIIISVCASKDGFYICALSSGEQSGSFLNFRSLV